MSRCQVTGEYVSAASTGPGLGLTGDEVAACVP